MLMKKLYQILALATLFTACNPVLSSTSHDHHAISEKASEGSVQYFIDVHRLGAGNVTAKAVAEAHEEDLKKQQEFGVEFVKYWVDEQKGQVYCLSRTNDPQNIISAHRAAHGLIPDEIHAVTDGEQAPERGGRKFFLDVHELGAGKVTAQAVAEAHEKDLAVQDQYQVNFIQYWVDEKAGKVFCLSEAPDSTSVIRTHKEAHGLLPDLILEVVQGE
jgi:hypothetical protein